MIFSKMQCLYIFIFLYGGAIIALFVRAFVRRRLLKDYESLKGETLTEKTTNKLLNFLLIIPLNIQAIRELGKAIAGTPDSVQRRYQRFQILNWISIALVVLVVIFSTVAHKICGS